jgi:Lon protease-like protein
LTRFIERRDDKRRQTEGERLEDDLWMETVKAYNERERRQIRAEWRDYHESQAERHRRTLEALITHHEGEAQKLLEAEPDEPKGA